MKLYKLLKDIDYMVVNGDENVNIDVHIDIKDISYDSRKVKENSIFVCINGANVNGHDFIEEAIKNGAVAIIVEEEFQFEGEEILLIKVKNTKLALASISNLFYS